MAEPDLALQLPIASMLKLCSLVAIAAAALFWQGPVPASASGVELTAVAAGNGHTCAVARNGAVWCWGNNGAGQLGDGTTTYSSTPVKVTSLGGEAVAVATGVNHSCALTSAGAVKCWGYNRSGVLGNKSTDLCESKVDFPCSLTPIQVSGLESGVTAIAAGPRGFHTCALLASGGVKCWGRGALGHGMGNNSTTPVNVVGLEGSVSAIAAAGGHTCAVTTVGAVKCWGRNSYGELGDGTSVGKRATAGDVVGLQSGVVGIAVGSAHTCALIEGGGVKCWGRNTSGQLGNGEFSSDPNPTPSDVVGLSSGVVAVAAGSEHTCALIEGGGVKCWGWNYPDQVSRSPVDVVGLTDGIVAIAAGSQHTCAVTATGGAKCWGNNHSGRLGDGTTMTRTNPVDVVGLKTAEPPAPAATSTVTPTQTPAATSTVSPTLAALVPPATGRNSEGVSGRSTHGWVIGALAAALALGGAAWYARRRRHG